MPARKTKITKSKKSGGGKNKKGGADTNNEISTINNFTSTRSPSPVNLSGSLPKSSEGFKADTTAAASPSYFSSANKSRLLSAPSAAATAVISAATTRPSSTAGKVFRYIIIIIILSFLALTIYLYLEKPKNTSIFDLYDPIFDLFGQLEKKNTDSGIKQIANAVDNKETVKKNNATGAATAAGEKATEAAPINGKKYKKLPVIPEADDSTSQTQMKAKSKAGFCYIGEDRGFRSCIEVGEADVCMSGDIFPTQAICINPRLRE